MSTVDVKITITRTTRGVDVTVSPFVAVIDLGDELQWTLDTDDDVKKVKLTKKKDTDHWPFVTDPPEIGKGETKKSGAMKKDAKYKNSYNITGKCTVGTENIDFVIDPDIIIIKGSTS